jgi:hypothetical protein
MQIIRDKKDELVRQREEQDQELEALLNQSDSDGDFPREDSDDEYQDTQELKDKLQKFKQDKV